MSISQNFPTVDPTLRLNFQGARRLDPRVTFTRASTATYVDEDGLIKTAGVDQARFDYDPATGESLGLLIEESRTNLIPHSQELNAATWNKYFGSSISANYAIAPDGTQTADKIIFDGTPAGQVVHNLSGLTIGQQYAFSAWVKSDGTSTTGCSLYVGGTAIGIAPTNEWQRIYVIRTAASTGENPLFLCGSANSLLVWGVQYEAGSFPTSYIPTSGSAVTRSADIAQITGTNFSSWYNPNKSTLYGEGRSITGGTDTQTGNHALVSIDDNTSNNRFILRRTADLYQNTTNSSGFTFRYRRSSVNLNLDAFPPETDSTGNLPDWLDSNIHKMAFAINNNGNTPHDIAAYGDGVSADFANTGDTYIGTEILTPYTAATQMQIGFGAASTYWNGHITKISYYPERLTNSQLQNLTK